MSLRAFHIVFIVVSILFTFGFAYWSFTSGPAALESRAMGGLSLAIGCGLLVYARWFIGKKQNGAA